jgi:hypothetical protein
LVDLLLNEASPDMVDLGLENLTLLEVTSALHIVLMTPPSRLCAAFLQFIFQVNVKAPPFCGTYLLSTSHNFCRGRLERLGI